LYDLLLHRPEGIMFPILFEDLLNGHLYQNYQNAFINN